MSLAPVVLFVYNRLDHTKRTVQSLQKTFLQSALIFLSMLMPHEMLQQMIK